MNRSLFALGVLLALVLGGLAGITIGRRGQTTADRPAEHDVYYCPMHPQVVSDRPGSCPICQMRLVPREGARDERDHAPDTEPTVPGLAAVTLSSRQQALIGVRTVTVEPAPFVPILRTVGLVAVDDRRVHHVHTKIPGWIEHLTAGAVGDDVRLDEALLSIYSPELLASQQEYLVALAHRARIGPTAPAGVAEDAERLVESAHRRLVLYDLTAQQIAELGRTGEAMRTVTLYSPVAGTITGRNVSHGERIESATSLLDIADLSRVWVLADVYPPDLAYVRVGQAATVRVSYLAGRTYHGRVDLVSPIVAPEVRTVKVRLEFDNQDLELKPGMFASVELVADLGPRLSVPKDAVLRTGARDVVFVGRDAGRFVPRVVTLGHATDERYEITAGLVAGDRVVAAASFFLDAESKLDAALAAPAGGAGHAGHADPSGPGQDR